MPLDKKGGFHINPQAARMHDAAPAMDKKPDPGQQDAAKGHVELHHGPAPDGQGQFHTIHMPTGEAKGHETLHDAHHAMNEHMGTDGCAGDGSCEHSEPDGDEGDSAQGSDGGDSDDSEY